MNSNQFRFTVLLGSLALLSAACTSASDATTTTAFVPTTTTTTTAFVPTTTTIVAPTTTTTEPTAQIPETINGLPGEEGTVNRRVVGIKIDNHLKARPQSALQTADVVYEVLVEGGITRFIALFHQSDLDWVGPNRSGRPTDSKIMAGLDGAPFQISGAQGWVKNIYKADGVNVIYDSGVTTFRVPNRPKPHNLFTSTILIREFADSKGWPDTNPGNLFAFGEPTPGNAEATRIEVAFSDSTPPTWAWDGEQYLRFHGTTPHEWVNDDGDSGQVAFDTLVVLRMRKYIAANPGGSGTRLPTVDTVGTGEAFVFHNGQVIAGTWERGSITDKFFLSTSNGTEIVLPPGRIWISLQPNTQPLDWE